MVEIGSEFIGLDVQELEDQVSKIEICLLTVLIQWGRLQIIELLIRGDEEVCWESEFKMKVLGFGSCKGCRVRHF